MQRYLLAAPIALGLCLATPAVTAMADPVSAFDGAYKGSMTLSPSGATHEASAPACAESRPVEMSISRGNVYMSYFDYKRHRLHYRGRVQADGRVSAYHRNGDGSASVMTGTVNGNQFTADMRRGRCDYAVTLTKG